MAHKNHLQQQVFSINAPGAVNVLLAGDFTNWQSKAIPMKKHEDGIWKATVKLAPGEYIYKFIVDGQWCDDPNCNLHLPNPYGGENSVRQVA